MGPTYDDNGDDDDGSDNGDDDDDNDDNDDNDDDNYSEGARKQNKAETSTGSVPPPCKADLLHRGG